MSDIFVKTAGLGSTGWRKATSIFVKTAGLGSTGWKSALGVWIKTATQWLKVWPLSGIFATRVPFIGYFSSDTYANRMPNTTYPTVRIGDSYFGNNAIWDLNGWTASSYTYKWKLYDQYGTDLAITLRSGTGSGWTSTGTGQDTLPTSIWTATNSTNSDTQYLGFEVTANNSSNSAYNGISVSSKIKILRMVPINISATLSTNSPTIGTAITYSSVWQSGEAYKEDSARTTIFWYKNSTSSTSGGTLIGLGNSYTPTTNNTTYGTGSDAGFYIYAVETRFNSGTDNDYGIATGVSAKVVTTNAVTSTPNSFTYSIYNGSTVTIPSTPTQTRASSTSNDVLIEFASSTPADTLDHTLYWSGAGVSGGSSNATIGTLNQYTNSADYSLQIATTASNSPISTYVVANGIYRDVYATLSSTTGASSWGVNFTWSGSQTYGLTYYSNGTGLTSSLTGSTVTTLSNSVDGNNRILIARISGSSNPTVTINSVTAYSSTGQTGAQKAGTAGTPTSLSAIPRPTSTSGTSTSNYTYYSNNQSTGSQRRVSLPSAFNSGTTLYVSTNGYINWGGADPAGSISIPTSGTTLAPLSADLRQGATTSTSNTSIGGVWYLGDSSNFYVTWWGNQYQDGGQVARYQVKFYWGQSYADVIIINNALTSTTPSTVAVQNGSTIYQDWSGTTAQASTQIAVSSMNRDSTNDGIDDARTVINAIQPIAPSGGSASISGGTAPGTSLTLTKTDATGSPSPSASWIWRRADGGTGGNSFTGGSTLQSNGNTYSIQNADVGYAIRAEVTWSNGVLPNQTVNTNSIIATAGQYTVTWNATANGGFGGGTTTQNAGVSHTAPSASKTAYTVTYSSTGQTSGSVPSATQSYFTVNGYYDTTSLSYTYGPIAIGGSFNAPYSITMYARYSSSSQAVTLSNQGTLLRTGYTFGGWNIGGVTYSAGSSYTPSANVTATAIWNQDLPPVPVNISAPTLSGGLAVGTTFTFGVGSWSNSPTSYDLRLYRGTPGVITSETLVKSAGNVTSSTYVIPQSDFDDPNNRKYYRAFASATNAGGTSNGGILTPGQELGPITTGATIPGTPTGVTLSGSGLVGWTASAGATSYEIEFFTAQSSTGLSARPTTATGYTVTGITGTSYQLGSTGSTQYASPNNYARVRVRARNTVGPSSYSGWVPSATTYT